MWRLLRFIITGAWHACRNVVIKVVQRENASGVYITDEYTLQCQECGRITSK